MDALEDGTIDLVVTSPPYPMIKMWDKQFSGINPDIANHLGENSSRAAFEAMHSALDQVWCQLYRVMKEGAFACINIGDATRSCGGRFQLFPNSARVQAKFFELGFAALPPIIWRKQTNAPNKFMGSGMLPAGAYVTLEHEKILIFRKGEKRAFSTEQEKKLRRLSGYFWEERNTWFSDLWDLKGARQQYSNKADHFRSAAYPFEIPFRLINMYSLFNDRVFDPFAGTGTTTLAAMASGRNSVCFEIDETAFITIGERIKTDTSGINEHNRRRLKNHLNFIADYEGQKGRLSYVNSYFGFPVMTAQEKELKLSFVKKIERHDQNNYSVSYYNDSLIRRIGSEVLAMDDFCFSNGQQLRFDL